MDRVLGHLCYLKGRRAKTRSTVQLATKTFALTD